MPESAPISYRPRALVTGASHRIGRAIAIELAARGCDVMLTYHTRREEAMKTAERIESLGGSAEVRRLDLDDLSAATQLGMRLAEADRPLDVLVHNASLYLQAPLEDAASAERLMRVNALGPCVLTGAAAPALVRSKLPGGSAVVAMGDMHALGRPRQGLTAYGMSKAALHDMVRSLARMLAPHVRVNAVAPGVIAWPESGPEAEGAFQERYLARVPLQRAGTIEEAAGAVRWLALEATYVTGQVLTLDGGRWLA
ncbi:MAG: SDR family oxidoreductase [Phycisphaeraceae bacterium]|nr:SDR family oxidoreductase [Phycisphaeraceae bacterium]MCW5753533.1 SDR family oxidoreductase [Phycisphaeraceae bacterium]